MKNLKVFFSLTLALTLAVLFTGAVAGQGQSGTTLTATVDATPHWIRTFHWTIDKSVTPATWDMFTGDSGTSTYTIAVVKDEGSDSGWIDGQICVTNGGAVATEGLTIVATLRDGASQNASIISVTPVTVPEQLDPGETGCYEYSVVIPPEYLSAGYVLRIDADITIMNHSGRLGEPFGPSPAATVEVPPEPTPVNGTIHVVDTNGDSWEFSDSGSVSYTRIFTCDEDEGSNENTAAISETGEYDVANVTVNCYALDVTKTANPSMDRTYTWSIDKSVSPSSLTLAINQDFLVTYAVVVNNTGSFDSNWAVAGNIYVNNPAPIDATINGVADMISDYGAVTVDCGVTFPYTLSAGGTLTCTYASALPDDATRTNTATATLQNTPSGTTDFSGEAAINFESAAVTEFDKCATVTDTFGGTLGVLCVGDILPHTYSYSRLVGPYETCGEYHVINTATVTGNDTGVFSSDTATVDINVPCGGCTLTIGYWKTHAGFGPQPDMVTPLLPQSLGSFPVSNTSTAVQILSFYGSNNEFNPSNGINKLYAQLLAAKLNMANGADGSAVSSVISSADSFLSSNSSTSWAFLSKKAMKDVLNWMSTLDNFNNGLIGPGHCSQ